MTRGNVKDKPINLFEFEEAARRKLSQIPLDYYASGACDEITLAENVAAFQRIFLRPRMLVDVSKRSLKTTVFGKELSMPIMIAPTAFQCMAHPDGELATARAAARAGTVMVVSTLATHTIEEVAAAGNNNTWFQLYVYKDRGLTRNLVERAEAAGCLALVLTVDSPLLGRRERDVRNCFHLPDGLTAANLIKADLGRLPVKDDSSGLADYIASLYDTSLTWNDLSWFRSITKMPILVKGILRGDDAELAIEYGASGIIVSNHGGRQLDTTVATIDALPEVAEATDGRVPLYIDGGIRRGTDVLKAVALGAEAVLVGRPVLWGLALDGENGVLSVLDLLAQELELAMALSGCPTVADISEDLVRKSHCRNGYCPDTDSNNISRQAPRSAEQKRD